MKKTLLITVSISLAWASLAPAQARGPKALWIIEGADHLQGYAHDPRAYEKRLAKFFHAHLR